MKLSNDTKLWLAYLGMICGYGGAALIVSLIVLKWVHDSFLH